MDIKFDETDYAIVDQLRRNGRVTNQEIAKALGLTATTVSTRIRKMEEADQLRVVAVSDFAAHGYEVLLRVAIEVDGRPVSEVARRLADLPQVFAAHMMAGRHDIDMLVGLREFDELPAFLMNELGHIEGIRSIAPAVVVDIVKYQFGVAPISSAA